MTDRLRFTILGCGSSPGTPRINGDWGACDPDNPKNHRRRCSLLIERFADGGVTTVVIDTTPDFRAQMLDAKVTELDGVLYTHSHADHIHGIDDLRGYALAQRKRIDIYADDFTMERLHQGFGYCFETPPGSMYPPILTANTLAAETPMEIQGKGGVIRALPVKQIHGDIHSLGFLFPDTPDGGLLYSPDISGIPDESLPRMQNLNTWIVDALQDRPHASHFSLQEALEWIGKLKPARAYLTHMHIPLDYDRVCRDTPDHVAPAYDGLQLEFDLA